jgi:UDP-N-acetylmuramoyl-tripeptide--D-alanyl-D-alanine ligase
MEACSGPRDSRIFDDTYNANPGSLKAALEVLAACPSERWLLLGDMGELGEEAAEFHRKAGIMARDFGVERLYTTGELSRLTATAFGDGAQHFPDVDALTAALNNDIHRNVTLLVKGSRAMQMDRVVKSLQAAGK